jgi:hypothetical protein
MALSPLSPSDLVGGARRRRKTGRKVRKSVKRTNMKSTRKRRR